MKIKCKKRLFFFTIKSGYSGSLINGQSKLLDSYNGLPMPRITRYLSKAKNQSVEKNKPTGKKKGSAGLIIWMVSRFLKLPQKQFIRNCPNQILFFFWRSIIIFSMMSYQPPPSLLRKVRAYTKKGRRKRKTEQKGGKRGGPFVCMHDVLPLMSPNYRKKKKKFFFWIND